MSFVEGFASAFVPMVQTYAQMTLKSDYEQENQYLKDWKDAQKSFEALRLKDNEMKEAAKTAVSMVPGVPPSAWTNAYRMLKAGYTTEQVNKYLTGATFTEIDPTAQVKLDSSSSMEPLTPAPKSGVDDQMAQSGMAGKDNENSFFSMFSKDRTVGRDKAIDKIVKETGLSRDEVMARIKSPTFGYQSNVPENKFQMTITPDTENVTSASVAGQWAAAQKRFANDPAGWEKWKTQEYPKLVEALNAGDVLGNSNTPNNQRLAQIMKQLQTETDPAKRAALEAEGNSILEAETALASSKRNEEPYSLVKINEDGTPSFLNNVVETPSISGGSKVKANGQVVDATGYRRVSPEERKEREAISRSSSVPIGEYRKRSEGLIPTIGLYGEIIDLVNQDERVTTSAASFASGVKKLTREVASFATVYQDIVNSKQAANPSTNPQDIVVTREELETRARDLGVLPANATLEDMASGKFLGDTTNRLASARSQLDAKLLLFTFRVAGLEGQSGNALSNKDFDRFKEILTGALPASDFKAKLGDIMSNRLTAAKTSFNAINDAPDIRNFQQQYGYNPIADGRLVMSIEDQIQKLGDPKITAAYQTLTGQGQQTATPPAAQTPPEVATPANAQPEPAKAQPESGPPTFQSGGVTYTYRGRGQNGEYVYDGPQGPVSIPSSMLFKTQ